MKIKAIQLRTLLLIMNVFIIGKGFSQTCPSGMVSFWKFDETSTVLFDDSYGNHDATSDNNVAVESNGKVGSAKYFNGSNAINVSSHSDFNFASNASFTIEFWMKYSGLVGSNTNVLIGRRDPYDTDGGAFWFIGINQVTGYLTFTLEDNAGNNQTITSDAELSTNVWHHIVAVRNGADNTNKLYIDGSVVGTPVTYDYPGNFTSTADINIGYLMRDGLPDYYIDGIIDEIAIYSAALTPAQISEHITKNNNGIGYCEGYAPIIKSTPANVAIVGQEYTYNVLATGMPTIVYSLVKGPSGMTLTDKKISWTPGSTNENGYVEIRASNGFAPADTQKFRIFISEAPVCPSNILALFKLDETAGPTYYDYYSDHTITATNSPSSATGKINGGQVFNANTKMDIPDLADEFEWTASSNFSFEFWAKTTNAATMVVLGRYRDDEYYDLANWWVGTDPSGYPTFFLRDNGAVGYQISGETAINDGAWHNIIAVRDGSAQKNILYVDGVKAAEVSTSYSNSFSCALPTELNIGWFDYTASGYHFVGSLDEIAIFNKAISAIDASAFFNAGSPAGHCAVGNYAPVITSTAKTSATEDATYTYNFTVEDIDAGDIITLSAPTKPSWLNFNYTAGQKAAVLTGTPTNSNVGTTNNNVVLKVSDGSVEKTQTFTINVQNVNDAPVITSSPGTSINEDQLYTYSLTVTDVDVSDVITMNAVTIPSWLTFNWTTGSKTATLAGTPTNSNIGNASIDITISDGHVTIHDSYTLNVVAVNDPPVISGQQNLSMNEDEELTLTMDNFTISDVDNLASEVSIKVVAGTNYTFTNNSVTPALNFNGTLTVNVVAADLADDSEVFATTITVNAVNDPPVISSVPDLNATVGSLYAYVFDASDVDNTTLTKSVVQVPSWMAFSAATGVLTGTPTASGQSLIILRVSDGTVSVDQSFTLAIISTGIEDLEAIGIKVYPVPAREYLTVQFNNLNEDTKLQLLNVNGGLVNETIANSGSEKCTLELDRVEPGMYYLRVENSTIHAVGKVVIMDK